MALAKCADGYEKADTEHPRPDHTAAAVPPNPPQRTAEDAEDGKQASERAGRVHLDDAAARGGGKQK